MESIVLAVYDNQAEADLGWAELRRQHDAGAVTIRQAVAMHRTLDGVIVSDDETAATDGTATAAGGLVGAVVGALAGPAGLLAGGLAGVALGSLVDESEAARDDPSGSLLVAAARIPRGAHAVVADIVDEADALNHERLGGLVLRWPRDVVEDEAARAGLG